MRDDQDESKCEREDLELPNERNGEAVKCVEGRTIAFRRREVRVLYENAS